MDPGTGTVLLLFTPICTVFLLWHGYDQFSAGGAKNRGRAPPAASPKVRVLDLASPASVRRCLGFWAELGVLLLYIYLCEHAPPAVHGSRFGSTGLFWTLFCLFILFSLCNIVDNKGGSAKQEISLLNREQTEEW